MIHLYWAYNKPSWTKVFTQTTIGYSVCGQRLAHKLLTKWPEDNECEECRQKMAQPVKRTIVRRRPEIIRRRLLVP